MFISLLITCATFLPILPPGALGSPMAVALPLPKPQDLGRPPYSGEHPNPEPCHGNCSWIHDPSIVYEDGVYWRFSTSGNIAIATASSLEGPWEYKGPLLHKGTSIHLFDNQDIWAPSVTKLGDTYYCHYSVSVINQPISDIGVATSQSLESSNWVDHGSIGLPQNPNPKEPRYNLIDPHVFQEHEDSPIYFTFGSHWGGIQQIELKGSEDLTAWAGTRNDITSVIRNTTSSYAVVEGAIMHKHENDYYIFYSVGRCCETQSTLAKPGDEYHVVVCRAEAITGPYVDFDGTNCLTENGGTTILASHGDVYAPGGQGIMLHPDSGRTVMYYHYVRPSIGYEADRFYFGFNYIDWNNGWPVVV